MLRDGAQIKILSCNQDLKITKVRTSRGVEQIDGTCRNMTDLGKILKGRNRKYSIRYMKPRRVNVENITHEDEICFGRLMTKVRMEHEQLSTTIQRKNRDSDKEVEWKQLASFHSTLQQDLSQVPMFDSMHMDGYNEETKISLTLVASETNNEDAQDIAECLKQMAYISKPIIVSPQRIGPKYPLPNIAKYRAFFEDLIRKRKSTDDNTLDWFEILNDQKACPFSGEYFQMALKSLAKFWKGSAYHPRKRVLLEIEGLQSAMEIFANDSSKERRFLRERLKAQDYWQKICYLFSKGSSQYYLIQYHLKYYNHDLLLDHFNKVTQGKNSNFSPQSLLLAGEPYYREFVMLLDCKYLEHCLRNEKFTEEKLAYIALREISLLMLKNQPYTIQLDYLKKAKKQLVKQFRIALGYHRNYDKIPKLQEELFSLGHFSKAIQLLFQYSKISTYQYLLLQALLFQSDIPHSKLLLYQPHKTKIIFKNVIITIVQEIKQLDTEQYLDMLSCFLPAFCKQDKAFVLKILTLNRYFFEYIMEFVGFPSLAETFSLDIEDVSPILKICIELHSNYSFCLYLGISSCINLLDLSKLVCEEKQQWKPMFSNQRLSNNHSQSIKTVNKGLDIFFGFPQRYIQRYEERFCILVDCMKMLIDINIDLTGDYRKRKQTYEIVSYLNTLFQQLSLDKLSKQIIVFLQSKDDETAKTYQNCLKKHKDMLILSFSMNRIKMAIFHRNFQSIVELLNLLFLQIADNFIKIAKDISSLQLVLYPDEVFLSFAGDIIHALIFLQVEKPKVIERNKIVLRKVCKQIHMFLNSLNLLKHQSALLFQKLQGIMRSLSHFPKER